MQSTRKFISDYDVEMGRESLQKQIVKPLTRRGALEAGLFCICSQASRWETAASFIYELRDKSYPKDPDARRKYSSLEVITNPKKVNEAAYKVGWRFAYANRFEPFIRYFGGERYLTEDWHFQIREGSIDHRDSIVEAVRWLGHKTYSFWNICLGGTDFIALDVWVMKNLRELGAHIPKKYVEGIQRKTDKQIVRATPSREEYLRMEQEARDIFSRDKRFKLPGGKVDLALVDGVLWWMGANRDKTRQLELLKGTLLDFPYAEMMIVGDEDDEDLQFP